MVLDQIAQNIGVPTTILIENNNEKDANLIGKIIFLMKQSPRPIIFKQLAEIFKVRVN